MNVSTATDQKLYVLHVMNRVLNICKHFFLKKWLSKSKEYIRIEKEIIRTDQQTAIFSACYETNQLKDSSLLLIKVNITFKIYYSKI